MYLCSTDFCPYPNCGIKSNILLTTSRNKTMAIINLDVRNFYAIPLYAACHFNQRYFTKCNVTLPLTKITKAII